MKKARFAERQDVYVPGSVARKRIKSRFRSVVLGAALHVCNLTQSCSVPPFRLKRLFMSDHVGSCFEYCCFLLLFLLFLHLQDTEAMCEYQHKGHSGEQNLLSEAANPGTPFVPSDYSSQLPVHRLVI